MSDQKDVELVTEDPPHCPFCGGVGVFMGELGSLEWWRCRACGMEFSTVGILQPPPKS
jgi:ribosomal protein L37AE/L43A